MTNRITFPLFFAAMVLAGVPAAAVAEEKYPSRPIKIIVPFPAGVHIEAFTRHNAVTVGIDEHVLPEVVDRVPPPS